MHYQHEELGAEWMDMGDWKRPRYYKHASAKTERAEALRTSGRTLDVSRQARRAANT